MNKAIIIPASFKGTLSSQEVGHYIEEGIHAVFPKCQTVRIPISDGGEGFVDAYLYAFKGKKIFVESSGPYSEKMAGFYGLINDQTAVFEIASNAGLPLVKGRENPSLTTTYGTGEVIRTAIESGVKHVVLGLGGSCTNDAGVGIAAALGIRFLDKNGTSFLPTGKTLCDIVDIDASKSLTKGVRFTVLCDVKHTFYGPQGAAYVFSPQKGANPEMVQDLDNNLRAYSSLLKAKFGFDTDFEGAGAAGGTPVSLKCFFGAEIKRGIETLLSLIDFERLIKDSDIIFTGEGKLDTQSFRGKVIDGVSMYAHKAQIPLVAIVGQIGDVTASDFPPGLTAAISVKELSSSLEQALLETPQNIRAAVSGYCKDKTLWK